MVSCKKSEMKKSTILFRGESAPKESGKKLESLPLCGDPLDDLRNQLIAKANELGFSNEEINRRLKEEPHLAEVILSESDITVDGYKLKRLNPSIRAFYILVARHPEGIEKEVDPQGRLNESFQHKYIKEYKDIFNKLERTRKEKEGSKGRSFDLDSRFPRYRNDVNKAITAIEEAHKKLNLSSCKIVGTKCWKITAKVIDLTLITTVPEL